MAKLRQTQVIQASELGRSNTDMGVKLGTDRGGDNTFGDSPLSPTGGLPATHYWASLSVTEEEDTDIRSDFEDDKRLLYDDTINTDIILRDLGLQRIQTPDVE